MCMGIGFGRYIKHITVDCLGCLMYLYLKMEGEQGGEKNVEDTGAGLIRVHLGGALPRPLVKIHLHSPGLSSYRSI